MNNISHETTERYYNRRSPSHRKVIVRYGTGLINADSIRHEADKNPGDDWVLERSTCKVDQAGEAELRVIRKHDSDRVDIVIGAGKVLDLHAIDMIHSVCELVRHYGMVNIIVDLIRTHRIQDSGLAMLLLLKLELNKFIGSIRIDNAGHISKSCYDYLSANFKVN